jgi:hypothetical protein
VNPFAILSLIQATAAAVETGKNLIDKFTKDENGQPLPPEAEVLPGVSVAAIQEAAAKGRAAAAELRASSQAVLDRLAGGSDAGADTQG